MHIVSTSLLTPHSTSDPFRLHFNPSIPLDTTSSPFHIPFQCHPNLWRQKQRTPVVPPPKLCHHSRDLGWLVFMHEVAGFGKDLQLVFALHLAYHELLVEAIGAGEEEELRAAAVEEFGAEVLEPG